MKFTQKTMVSIILFAAVLLAACGGGAPKVEWELKVGGAVSTPLTLSFQDVAGLTQMDMKDYCMERRTGQRNLC